MNANQTEDQPSTQLFLTLDTLQLSLHWGRGVQYVHLMQASLWGRKAVQAFLQGRKAVEQWPVALPVLTAGGKRGEFVVLVAAGEGGHRAAWTLFFVERCSCNVDLLRSFLKKEIRWVRVQRRAATQM